MNKGATMNRLDVSQQSFYYWLPPATITEKNLMEKSGTYAACEQIIQMPFMIMRLSKLDEMLKRLEENGRLNAREHQGLIELARKTWRVNA
jgi:hypothetical protein